MSEEINTEQQKGSAQEEVVDSGITFTPEPREGQEAIDQVQSSVNIETENQEQEFVDVTLEELEAAAGPSIDNDLEDDEYLYVEPNDDILLRLLKDKKGITAENLDDLVTPKEQKKYAPEMEKFNEFIEKTGNKNYNDFLETQKDWSTEKEDVVLKNYIKLSNPSLSEKEVQRIYDKKYNIEGLDQEDDEDEILDRGINTKTDLQKANEFFAKRKEEWNVVGGSDEHIPLEYREAKKVLDSQKKQDEEYQNEWNFKRNDFVSKTESLFNSNFEGFKIQLGDEKTGFEEFTIKPENLNEIKESQLDSSIYDSQFFDPKTGELIKPKEYHESKYMSQNYKSELNKAYMRGRAKELEIQDKLSKNIQADNIREVASNGKTGISYTLEK